MGVRIVALDGGGGAVVAGAFGFFGRKGAVEKASACGGFGECVSELYLFALGGAEDGFSVADIAGNGTDFAVECAEDAVGVLWRCW